MTMTNSSSPTLPALIGDIGGTNVRFQIVVSANEKPLEFDLAQTQDFESLESAIDQVVFKNTKIRPKTAIIAAAGPITKLGLNLTNCPWNIQAEAFLKATPFDNLILMNDFEAQALALPQLEDDHLAVLGELATKPRATKIVVGPGTGLGVGLMVRTSDQWIPVAGEGGHIDMGPRNDREAAIWDKLEKAKGRISAEQLLSGSGIINLYRACCGADSVKPVFNAPRDVSRAALDDSNPQAVEALEIFCRCLGRIAGDVALLSMAKGGVYIAGGIAKKILPFLNASDFRKEFEDKAPHSELMSQIPTFVVTHELPALMGLASFAQNPGEFLLDTRGRHWSK